MKASDYYRSITEVLPKKHVKKGFTYVKSDAFSSHLIQFFILFSIFSLVFLMLYSVYVYGKYKEVQNMRIETVKTYRYWKQAVVEHPNFTDAYYNAAVYGLKLGKTQESLDMLSRAIQLDPQFTDAIKLKKELEGN